MRPWWMVFLLAGCGHDGPEVPDPAAMLLARLDTDGSGDLVSSELAAVHPDKVLHELDKDKDGVISLEELRADLDAPVRGRGGGGPGGGPGAGPPPGGGPGNPGGPPGGPPGG